MTKFANKVDFALVFTAHNSNPNGDPLDGNRPRTTYDGHGEVSDVCIKRKIRNRLIDMGQQIFVQSDDRRADEFRSLKDRADAVPELKNSKSPTQYALLACEKWLDVRAFGQVFAFKKGKGKDEEASSDAVSVGIRGPVSIQSAFSVDQVGVTDTQITKSVNLETNNPPDKKGKDTMGMKHRVDFGLYVTYGAINVQATEKTGFSDEDAQVIKAAMRTLFVNDATSARPDGSMEVIALYWWQHNCPMGQYSSAKVHRSLKIKLKDGIGTARSVDDYEITVEQLPNLSLEVIEGE